MQLTELLNTSLELSHEFGEYFPKPHFHNLAAIVRFF